MIVRKPKVHPDVVALTHKINTAKAANRNVPEWAFVAAGDLARECGAEPCDVIDEFSERAAAREYSGGLSRGEAEKLAWSDTEARYRKQMELAV